MIIPQLSKNSESIKPINSWFSPVHHYLAHPPYRANSSAHYLYKTAEHIHLFIWKVSILYKAIYAKIITALVGCHHWTASAFCLHEIRIGST